MCLYTCMLALMGGRHHHTHPASQEPYTPNSLTSLHGRVRLLHVIMWHDATAPLQAAASPSHLEQPSTGPASATHGARLHTHSTAQPGPAQLSPAQHSAGEQEAAGPWAAAGHWRGPQPHPQLTCMALCRPITRHASLPTTAAAAAGTWGAAMPTQGWLEVGAAASAWEDGTRSACAGCWCVRATADVLAGVREQQEGAMEGLWAAA